MKATRTGKKFFTMKVSPLLLLVLSSTSHSYEQGMENQEIPPLALTSEEAALVNLPIHLFRQFIELHEVANSFRSRASLSETPYLQEPCSRVGHRIIQRLEQYYIDSPYTSAPMEAFEEVLIGCSDNNKSDNPVVNSGHIIFGSPVDEKTTNSGDYIDEEKVTFIQMGSTPNNMPFTTSHNQRNRWLQADIIITETQNTETAQQGEFRILEQSTKKVDNNQGDNVLLEKFALGDPSSNSHFYFEFYNHYDSDYESYIRSERFSGRYGISIYDASRSSHCFGGYYEITAPEIIYEIPQKRPETKSEPTASGVYGIIYGEIIVTDLNENQARIEFDRQKDQISVQLNNYSQKTFSYKNYIEIQNNATGKCR